MVRTSTLALGLALAISAVAQSAAAAEPAAEDFASWPPLRSTFPSTGGGGITIKGYDPVITAKTCMTTFMAVESPVTGGEPAPKVYANVVEFDAVPVQGGTLCQNGRWRAFEGGASGTTPFRVFYKDGVFRAAP